MLAPLFSLVLAVFAVLPAALVVAAGDGVETTGATVLVCVVDAVLTTAVVGAIITTGSDTAGAVVAGSINIGGGNSLFNASRYPGQVGLYS